MRRRITVVLAGACCVVLLATGATFGGAATIGTGDHRAPTSTEPVAPLSADHETAPAENGQAADSWKAGSGASEGAYKAATDPNPVAPLTPAQEAQLAKKQEVASTFLSGAARSAYSTIGPGAVGSGAVTNSAIGGAPWAASLSQDQNPQKTAYYCGPATVNEALGQMGKWFTQAQLAAELGTTEAGTGWGSGYSAPVPRVMNAHQSRNLYFAAPLSYAPSASDVYNYEIYLIYDIWGRRVPVIGDAYEVPGGFRLAGHPSDRTIYHWFDIYGYSGDGAYTLYEDSVHGVSPDIISWAPNVPAYSTQASNEVVQILGGRGYVW